MENEENLKEEKYVIYSKYNTYLKKSYIYREM